MPTFRTPHRRGLTLIEALIAVAVIVVLIGLLLPAIMSSREAANRTACMNHLRQIGVALHNYESSHGVYPSSIGSRGGGFRSFLVALLPSIENRPLYDSINFSFDLHGIAPANNTAMHTEVEVFLCPSDREPTTGFVSSTNYAGSRGGGVQRFGYNGFFALDEAVSPSDIRDGLSHTVAASEWIRGSWAADAGAGRKTFYTATSYTQPDEFELFARTCRNIDQDRARTRRSPRGSNWFFGDFGHALYNHVLPPNNPSCINGNSYQEGAWTSGSFHSGGVNVLMADGHVSWITSNIPVATWRALASRSGNEAVSQY